MCHFQSIILSSDQPKLIDQYINQLKTDLGLSLQPNQLDIITINHETGWGIDQIRFLKKIVMSPPIRANKRLVIIDQSQNLTTESQNSLLKLLEEPPTHTFFLLITNNINSLLETIRSRCLIVKTGNCLVPTQTGLIVTKDLKQNLSYGQTISQDKQKLINLITDHIIFLQRQLLKSPSYKTSRQIRLLGKSLSMISANVNPTSALDFFYLSI